MALISNELKNKNTKVNVLAPLGSFVYYRTYSRWVNELGRRETWWETVTRAVEYNTSLDQNCTTEEAEELAELIFNLKGFLSGRTFWVGGSDAVKHHALGNFNCALVVLDKFSKLKDLFYALMVGTGVGFRCLEEDVQYLPKIRKVGIIHKYYKPKKKHERLESTSVNFTQGLAIIEVGDSKEGWTQALDFYFSIVTKSEYKHIEYILFDYSSVRPKGERLKKFGGTASGYGSIQDMFVKIEKVLSNRLSDNEFAKVRPIDMLDFATAIAENVQVGGVRRSAEIGLIGANDTECIQAKNNLYIQDENGNWIANQDILHRRNSNNTIIHYEKPSRDFWHWQFEQQRFSGEPASYNGAEALRRNPNFKGTNPCGEILLDDLQTCNLVTNNVMAHVVGNKLDISALIRTHELLTRASYRLTLVDLEIAEWDYKLHRDRLLGVSLTGWQDMVNATGMTMDEQKALLQLLRKVARDSADSLADNLGLNKSLLVTTLKPEGTLSLLPTVSSGLHFSHSDYYIRRVRINADDALVKVCQDLGYSVQPEVGSTIENARTLVIAFPVKAPTGRTKYDVGAIEQLEIYKMFMENYVEHNASITVSVREHEWEAVEQWHYDNWDSVIGISYLSLDDNYYQLMPYEAITEEEYNERKTNMADFDATLLSKYEVGTDHDVDDSECTSGTCPIR